MNVLWKFGQFLLSSFWDTSIWKNYDFLGRTRYVLIANRCSLKRMHGADQWKYGVVVVVLAWSSTLRQEWGDLFPSNSVSPTSSWASRCPLFGALQVPHRCCLTPLGSGWCWSTTLWVEWAFGLTLFTESSTNASLPVAWDYSARH